MQRIEVAIDGGAFAPYVSTLTFAEGSHTVSFRAIDNLGNVEMVHAVSLRSDAMPPASALEIGAPKFDPGAGRPVFVAAATLLSLAAQDPVVSNIASGVRQIAFRRGSDPFATYAAPFALPPPDGLKTLDYFATDNVGNAEAAQNTSVALDDTSPATSLAVLGGRQFPGPGPGSFYASAGTRYALSALDPLSGGAASGLASTRYQDNAGAFQLYASTFGLAEGGHLLVYQSQDRVQEHGGLAFDDGLGRRYGAAQHGDYRHPVVRRA